MQIPPGIESPLPTWRPLGEFRWPVPADGPEAPEAGAAARAFQTRLLRAVKALTVSRTFRFGDSGELQYRESAPAGAAQLVPDEARFHAALTATLVRLDLRPPPPTFEEYCPAPGAPSEAEHVRRQWSRLQTWLEFQWGSGLLVPALERWVLEERRRMKSRRFGRVLIRPGGLATFLSPDGKSVTIAVAEGDRVGGRRATMIVVDHDGLGIFPAGLTVELGDDGVRVSPRWTGAGQVYRHVDASDQGAEPRRD